MKNQTTREPKNAARPGEFRPWRLITTVLLILVLIGLSARWYARDVTLPRYCQYPQEALIKLRRVMTEKEPAGAEPRRPYIIAARLLFLVPQENEEPLETYLARVRVYLEEQCP